MNKNTYQVYVIQMIVIGAAATPLLYLDTPFYIKLPILTVTAFALSNLLVHAARGAGRMQLPWNWLKPQLFKEAASEGMK